jgi:hypothetical protein
MTAHNLEDGHDAWPRLDLGDGPETSQALLLWGQIVGKTRLATSPMVNHWWQVPLRDGPRFDDIRDAGG